MNEPQPQPAPRCKCQWLRVGLVVLLVLVVAYASYRYILHQRVESRLDAIRKQGYPVTLAELDKSLPRPPHDENAADIYTNALAHSDPWNSEQRKVLPEVGMGEWPPHSEPLSDEMCERIASHLYANKVTLDLLHKAATLKQCRFSSDITMVTRSFWPPYLKDIRRQARLLKLEAVLRAAESNPEAAAESALASIALSNSLLAEPFSISHLTRRLVTGTAVSTLERVLNRVPLEENRLLQLQTALGKAEGPQVAKFALLVMRCEGSDMFGQLSYKFIQDQGFGLSSIDEILSPIRSRPRFFVYRATGLVDLDHSCFLALMSESMKILDLPPAEERLKVTHDLEARVHSLPKWRALSKYQLSILGSLMEKELRSAVLVSAARTAIAIERYRIATGKPPDRLTELSPFYLQTIPQDPFDGRPLRYRKLGQCFVVYSIGPDGQDNDARGKGWETSGHTPGTDITFTVER